MLRGANFFKDFLADEITPEPEHIVPPVTGNFCLASLITFFNLIEKDSEKNRKADAEKENGR